MGKGRLSIYSKELEDSIIDLIESGLSDCSDGRDAVDSHHQTLEG